MYSSFFVFLISAHDYYQRAIKKKKERNAYKGNKSITICFSYLLLSRRNACLNYSNSYLNSVIIRYTHIYLYIETNDDDDDLRLCIHYVSGLYR